MLVVVNEPSELILMSGMNVAVLDVPKVGKLMYVPETPSDTTNAKIPSSVLDTPT